MQPYVIQYMSDKNLIKSGGETGSLVAAVFNMKFWKSLLSAIIGILIAGVVMTLVSYGVVALFA